MMSVLQGILDLSSAAAALSPHMWELGTNLWGEGPAPGWNSNIIQLLIFSFIFLLPQTPLYYTNK